ncbi:hypothetical protein C8R47DRAFT_1151493 [Mycena vitilis]|nr:hypothetical protein C8R47DRAFT_1151493 [Mycena vitilis]
MPSSELSLRHLPDLSDASFSFQIPVDSGDDLLHTDSNDFFGGGTSILGSPSALRANDAPLTLSDLTPLASATPAPFNTRSPPKIHKSLLPTTRSNIQDLTGSQIASRVPKPISATRRKPKQAVIEAAVPPTEAPADTKPLSPATTQPNTQDAPNEVASPSVHDLDTPSLFMDDFSFQLQATSSVPSASIHVKNDTSPPAAPLDPPAAAKEFVEPLVAAATEKIPELVKATEVHKKPVQKSKKPPSSTAPALAKTKPAPSANTSRAKPVTAPAPPAPKMREPPKSRPATNTAAQTESDPHAEDEGTGIAARLLMYGAHMATSFPDDTDNALTQQDVPIPAPAPVQDEINVARDTVHELTEEVLAPPAESKVDLETAVSFGASDENVVIMDDIAGDTDTRMVVDAPPDLEPESQHAPHSGVSSTHASALVVQPRDDLLTLSQLSPRKTHIDESGAAINESVRREGALSPMRPSAKRPSSSISTEAEAGVRSKKRAVTDMGPPPPRAPSVSTRATRGRSGASARAVSAPVHARAQPARRAKASTRATAAPQPKPVVARPRIAAGSSTSTSTSTSASGAPKIQSQDKAKRAVSVASSSSSLGKNTATTTAPVEFNFQIGAGVGGSQNRGQGHGRGQGMGQMLQGETHTGPKPYAIPDFAALHASQAAQSKLRRSQRAPTVPVPIAFCTDMRVRERGAFDERVRENEREAEAAKEARRRQEEEEEAREVKEMRKRAIPKAHEVPGWYREAPKRERDGEDQ